MQRDTQYSAERYRPRTAPTVVQSVAVAAVAPVAVFALSYPTLALTAIAFAAVLLVWRGDPR
jgi:ABC-type transport system involved in cytochrome c biogenesis permease subunit